MQGRLINEEPKATPSLARPYARGPYNKCNDEEQWIRIGEGCPNRCPYCRESVECGVDPIYLPIPEIVRNKVKILDMNPLFKPRAAEILKDLGSRRVAGKVVHYEYICGIDYRFLTPELAVLLKENRFENIRLAWDWYFNHQMKVKDAVKMLVKAGYSSDDLTVFMICNWKVPYEQNMMKLDLCKIWRVKVADCYFDNQLAPNIKPIHWTDTQIKDFRARCRKHNQLVGFGIDPEYGK